MELLFQGSGLKLLKIAPDLAGIPSVASWKKPDLALGKGAAVP